MQISDLPARFAKFWANAVTAPYVRDIPVDAPAQAGAASFETGFPPPNFTPVAAGGIPPFGADMNGILRAATQWLQWLQAGGTMNFFNLEFATNIGGYPQGAMLAAIGAPGNFWISLVDNNVNNPDTDGTDWLAFPGTSFRFPSRIITNNATVDVSADTDYSIGLNRAAPAPQTVNLAATGTLTTNQVFEVVDLSGNLSEGIVTLVPPGGHTIGGAANFVMTNDRQYTRVKYFGSTLWGVQA